MKGFIQNYYRASITLTDSCQDRPSMAAHYAEDGAPHSTEHCGAGMTSPSPSHPPTYMEGTTSMM